MRVLRTVVEGHWAKSDSSCFVSWQARSIHILVPRQAQSMLTSSHLADVCLTHSQNPPTWQLLHIYILAALLLQLETNSWYLIWYWSVILGFQKKITDICKMRFRSSWSCLRPTYMDWVTSWRTFQPHAPCFLWLSGCFQENYLTAKSSESCVSTWDWREY